jgi:hypothetical protein
MNKLEHHHVIIQTYGLMNLSFTEAIYKIYLLTPAQMTQQLQLKLKFLRYNFNASQLTGCTSSIMDDRTSQKQSSDACMTDKPTEPTWQHAI